MSKRRRDDEDEVSVEVYILTPEGLKALARASTKDTTDWQVATFQRMYKGLPIWVEHAYLSDPQWEWHVQDNDDDHMGRAFTSGEAQDVAEAKVREIVSLRARMYS